MDLLVSEATVGETYFFRDPAQFDAVRDVIVPKLLGERTIDAPIDLWSAGCASGEEAYSLAILLAEMGLFQNARVLGTDVSRAAIEAAESGVYGEWSFRGVEHPWRERWFVGAGARWAVTPRLRSRVRFRVHNLARPEVLDLQPAGIDIIICRNVLMYFDEATRVRVVKVLAEALAPHGWLLLGSSDPLLPAEAELERVTTPAGIMYRRTSTAAARPREEPDSRLVAWRPSQQHVRASGVPLPAGGSQADSVSEIGRIRAMVERGARDEALVAVSAAARRHPLEPELHVLQALLMLDLGLAHEAVVAARRALYLDDSLVLAHLVYGKALRLTGRYDAARRALRCCRSLIAAWPPEEPVPLAGATSSANLAASSFAELRLLDRLSGSVLR